MIHALPSIGPDVGNEPVPIFRQASTTRHIPGREKDSTREPRIVIGEVVDGTDVLSGNQENVFGGLRVQIAKGQEVGVFVHERSREVSACNPAEDACIGFLVHLHRPHPSMWFNRRIPKSNQERGEVPKHLWSWTFRLRTVRPAVESEGSRSPSGPAHVLEERWNLSPI